MSLTNDLWAVIPSCCRLEELTALITTLRADEVKVVIINTGYDESAALHLAKQGAYVLTDTAEPKNISRWWNVGLKFVDSYVNGRSGDNEYTVAVLNDDIVVERGFVRQLAEGLQRHDATAACPNVYSVRSDLKMTALNPYVRMTGYAFALRGSKRVRADERFVWWYGDNDIDWQTRVDGGMVVLADTTVQHLYPNSTTVGELAEQAGRDRETFIKKWGDQPW